MTKRILIVTILIFLALSSFGTAKGQNFATEAERVVSLLKDQKYNEAKQAANRLVRQATGSAHVGSLSYVGAAFFKHSLYAEAEPLFKRALEIAEKEFGKEHLHTGQMLSNLGGVYREQGRYEEAELLFKRSVAILEKQSGADSEGTAISLSELGQLHIRQGRFAEAEQVLQRALDIIEKRLGKNHVRTSIALDNLAALYSTTDRFEDAERLFKRSLEITNKELGKDQPESATTMSNLAELYRRQGRYMEAETLQRQVFDLLQENIGKHPATAFAADALADIYASQARFEDAATFSMYAWSILNEVLGEDHPLTMQIFTKLIKNYGTPDGDAGKAETFLKHTLESEEKRLGKSHPLVAGPLQDLVEFYFHQNRYAEAEPFARRTLEIQEKEYGKDSPDLYAALFLLAHIYNIQGQHAKAEPLYDRAITLITKSGKTTPTRAALHQGRAFLYKATKRPQEAVTELKRAMDISLDMRKNVSGSDEERAETFLQFYKLFEAMVDWQREFGDMNEAYEAMERSRAQGLQDLMDSCGIDLLVGVPAETVRKFRAEEAALLTEIASYDKQLEVLPQRANLTAAQKRTEETNLTEARRFAHQKLVNVMNSIRAESPAFQLMSAQDRKPVALDTIRKELDTEKTLALEYLIGENTAFVLVYGFDVEPKLLPLELNESQAKLFDVEAGMLTAKKLETMLQNKNKDGVLQQIADAKYAEKNALPEAKTLDKLALLWTILLPDEQIRAKIVTAQTFERLLILPDGALARLPFEALVVEPDTINPFYLLDRGPAVIYAPSATMYYNLKHRKTESGQSQVLTVGNPDYKLKRDAKPTDAFSDIRGSFRAARMTNWDQLGATAIETERIAESCRKNGITVTRFDLAQSTEENVRKNVAGRKIVHLACHGYAENEFGKSLFSALALTIGDPDDPKNDGYLELAEMFGLDLKSCELAVLSACETNLGPNQQGEGSWSMGRGMSASGAKRVVTTGWQVEDNSTANLIAHFIDTIIASNMTDYASALRQAKREIRNDRDNQVWRHPYYWAPFVLIGPN